MLGCQRAPLLLLLLPGEYSVQSSNDALLLLLLPLRLLCALT
jgi:hypothetical protein